MFHMKTRGFKGIESAPITDSIATAISMRSLCGTELDWLALHYIQPPNIATFTNFKL